MIRTRDFVLIFTIVVFLVAAIGATIFDQWRTERQVVGGSIADIQTVGEIASTSDLVLVASLPEDQNDRAIRLAELSAKVAQVDFDDVPETVAVEPEIESPESVVSTTTAETEEVAEETLDSEQIVMTCANNAPYAGFWDARDLTVKNREGAVVVERLIGTTTQTILQLTARSLPAATPTCLGSDVIGIANDGSLIRNDEFAFYGIFGSDTRVGYSLDGFPIYGVGTTRGDVCGGLIVAGQYRYELSTDRDTLISCFSATPTNLP